MATVETVARYDGIADWYDSVAEPRFGDALADLLGPGEGLCLDVGCGTGRYFDAIRATGRDIVGVDLSADQLRLAGSRCGRVVRASADALPFASGVFPTVTAIWVSTDIDDFAAAMREVARVLRADGRVVILGVHPCFNGPCVESGPDGTSIVHSNYREEKRHLDAPWWGRDGIRHRAGGMQHLPLAALFRAVLASGLRIDDVQEPGDDPIPVVLALTARLGG